MDKTTRWAITVIGVMIACQLIYLIVYYRDKTTETSRDIEYRNSEIAALLARKKEIDPVQERIEELKERVTGYYAVSRKHVRLARIMDRLCTAVNAAEQVWLRRFEIHPDYRPGKNALTHEISYEITLSGCASGTNDVDRVQYLSDFIMALERTFREKTDRDGTDPFLSARFERPSLLFHHSLEANTPRFENAIEFALSMGFTLIPNDKDTDETEFKFTPSNRRDPFVPLASFIPELKAQPGQPQPKVEQKPEREF